MLGRLIFGIHWVLFVIFLGLWILCISALAYNFETNNTEDILFEFLDALFYKKDALGFISVGLMTWIPVLFLFIDYVINGKWTWFPWQRNKD